MTVGEAERRITIGVVNYNGALRTQATVASVLEQGAKPASVVVVDNGSDPADREALRAGLPAGLTIIELADNGGYAAGCNEIARRAIAAGSRFVWFLNNDLDLETGVLAALMATLESDPSAFGVGPVTVDANDPSLVLGAGASLSVSRARVSHRALGHTRHRLPSEPYEVDMLEGACPLVSTVALRQTGGWDEGFFMYWEDAELSIRARRAGYRLRIVPTAFVRHIGAASSAREQREALMLRGRVRFSRIVAARSQQMVFLVYYTLLWLPAYTAARLMPRFGLKRGIQIAAGSLVWNIRDALRRGRWGLHRRDQEIPAFEDNAAQGRGSAMEGAADHNGTAGWNAGSNAARSQNDA